MFIIEQYEFELSEEFWHEYCLGNQIDIDPFDDLYLFINL